MKITIFGAGAFGTALGNILETNGHQIEYYDPAKYPDKSLTSAIEGTELNILAVPSSAAPKIMLFLPHDIPLVCASKGFLTMASFRPWGTNFAIISGGAFAADLNNHNESVLTVTSPLLEELFKAPWLHFDETNDTTGVLLCGTLKNIYAIGSGYWGLKYGTPDFDDYINSALAEMRTIVAANGGKPETVNLSCGLRDLVITCASEVSRNYDFGAKLKKDPELGKKTMSGQVKAPTTEGLIAISQIPRTPSFVKPTNTPIFDRIIALVNNTAFISTTTGEEQNAAQAAKPQQPAPAQPVAPAQPTTPMQPTQPVNPAQ